MIKTYYSDPYLKKLKTKPGEATIFYPECGGQPGDRGFADDIKILDTKKAEDGSSIYILENGKTLSPDQEYTFSLDWNHRYRFMKMHACQHMLSGLLFNLYSIGTVAVHLGDEYFTIEIDKDSIDSETVEGLIENANRIISEGHRIVYHEKSHEDAEKMGLRRSIKVEGDVRLVEIEGVDIIACGGVHVANTAEIGLVLYFKQEQIRGHVRLFFKCAEDAVRYSLSNQKYIQKSIAEMGCSESELPERCSSVNAKLKESLKQVELFGTQAAVEEVKKHISDGIAAFESETDASFFCKTAEKFENLALCVVSNGKWLVLFSGKFEKTDFNKIRQNVLLPLGAKGGGKNSLYQGIVGKENTEKLIEGFISQLKS